MVTVYSSLGNTEMGIHTLLIGMKLIQMKANLEIPKYASKLQRHMYTLWPINHPQSNVYGSPRMKRCHIYSLNKQKLKTSVRVPNGGTGTPTVLI